MTPQIVVVDYDPAWPHWFEQVCAHVWPAVSDVAIRIDHVGSTSVPGLAAKPIIDMDIVVAAEDGVPVVAERLAGVGYTWIGDLGIEGREVFRPSDAWDAGFDDARGPGDLPHHHLYLVVEDNRAHMDHWLLRDLLRTDAGAQRRYADLKRRNAVLSGGDMAVYEALKASLVAALLTRARAERGLPPAVYWDPETAG